jgi:hypothetical protein
MEDNLEHPLIPLELAQRITRLSGTPEWGALMDYLSLREGQLGQTLLSRMNERDTPDYVQNTAMVGRGALLEIIALKTLPEVSKGICIAAAKEAEKRGQ